jgi:hypothetical protein
VTGDHTYKLWFSPYQAPACRVGGKLFCKRLNKRVEVVGFSDAPIPWPCCLANHSSRHSLILCGDLVKAVKRESELAIVHHFGAKLHMVFKFRQALGVKTQANPRVPEQERPQPPVRDLPDLLLDAAQFREQFGARLKELREEAELTQKQLWERARLSTGRMQAVENGEQPGPRPPEPGAVPSGAASRLARARPWGRRGK